MGQQTRLDLYLLHLLKLQRSLTAWSRDDKIQDKRNCESAVRYE